MFCFVCFFFFYALTKFSPEKKTTRTNKNLQGQRKRPNPTGMIIFATNLQWGQSLSTKTTTFKGMGGGDAGR